MTETTIPIRKIFNTIEDVENECNFIELVFPGIIKSLKADGSAEKHVTQGVFDRLSSKEFMKMKDKLGNLTFKLDDTGTNTVWIKGKITKVSFK